VNELAPAGDRDDSSRKTAAVYLSPQGGLKPLKAL
jgi:hypothetical protein